MDQCLLRSPGVPFRSTAGQGVSAYKNCSQTWDDVSDSFWSRWTSANTAIATVDYYGTHTGAGVGSTTSNTWGNLDGVRRPPTCPIQTFYPSGGVNVCEFTPAPAAISASDCTDTKKQVATFNASPTTGAPSLAECGYNGGASTCSATASGNVDIVSTTCSMGVAPSGSATYYCGQPGTNGNAINFHFTLVLNAKSYDFDWTAPVTCP